MIVYGAINSPVANLIPPQASSILDIGCGDGSLGAWLIQRNSAAVVHGLTFSEAEASQARKVINQVWVVDLNQPVAAVEILSGKYDYIVCSHVLEHLLQPWDIVQQLEHCLVPGGKIIIAIPNILFFKQRMQFLFGRFRYSKTGGLMDETHFRFFDWKTVDRLLEKSQLTLQAKFATGMFPQPLLRKLLPKFCGKVDAFFVANWPGLFGMQFLLVASHTIKTADVVK